MDADLKKGIRAASGKQQNFGLVIKGNEVVALIVSAKAIKSAELQKARARAGGGNVFNGTCGAGDKGGILEFKLEKGVKNPKAEDKLKRYVKNETGMSIDAVFVEDDGLEGTDQEVANEEEQVDEAPREESSEDLEAAPPPPPLSDDEARQRNEDESDQPAPLDLSEDIETLKKRMKNLTKMANKVIQADPANARGWVGRLTELKNAIGSLRNDDARGLNATKASAAQLLQDLQRATPNEPQESESDQALLDNLLNGSPDKLADFKKAFGDKERQELVDSFGAQGMRDLNKILNDLCNGDAKKLSELSSALR